MAQEEAPIMEKQEAEKDSSSSSSSEESDDDDGDDDDYYDSDDSSAAYSYESESDGEGEYDNSPAANIKRFTEVLESKQYRKRVDAEDRDYVFYEDLFDFPKDRENWREEDLKELWADAPMETAKPGWDPAWADVDDCEMVREQIKAGKDPAIAPFYLPYRKYYPAIPDNHYDISNPKSVIEELDRIEEFLKWVSYVFPDGSSTIEVTESSGGFTFRTSKNTSPTTITITWDAPEHPIIFQFDDEGRGDAITP